MNMESPDIILPPSILIVEDDNISLFVLKKMLESDFNIHIASNSQEALQKIEYNPVDLILMDINLGEDSLDGIQLMKEIRKKESYKALPIFAITSYAMAEDQSNFLEEGFDSFLPKPIKKEELFKAIDEMLSDKDH